MAILTIVATIPYTLSAQNLDSTNLQSQQGQQMGRQMDCSDPLQSNSGECSGQRTGQTFGLPSQPTTTEPRQPAMYSDTDLPYRTGQTPRPIALLPEPLTEFQKFVASTTGEVLPIFGAELFRNVPSTFAPLDMAPVPADYVVGPGDELRIRVWGQVAFQANLRIDRSGDIYLPHVGPVHVTGLKFSELSSKLHDAVGRVYRNFDLTVDIGQIRAIQVYVTGAARRPGMYTVSALSTLLDALFASGGPSTLGSMRHVQLRRGGEVVSEFDLYDMLERGDKTRDAKLLSGDVLFIPHAGQQVAAIGSVRNPAIYEIRQGETLSEFLADAGGVSSVAASSRISIERIEDHESRLAMEVAADQAGLSTKLADGDLVRVHSIVPEYRNTVTLRGNIANPGRFAWHAGMHVSELIPDKDSLITRNYWWRRTQLGLPAPEFESATGLANSRQPLEPTPVSSDAGLRQAQALRAQAASIQAGNAFTTPSQGPNAQGTATQANGPQYPLPPSSATSAGNTQMGQNQQPVQGQSRATVASVVTRGTNSAEKVEVEILAPEIDWDYAAIERLDRDTLKTVVIPFDLGKLVRDHDSSADLELQPGDVVTIFSEGDIRLPIAQQTKLVKLEGEFAHAGSYTVKPGETLRELVERAGGFTPSAYLYGSEFARESTRVIQQARIDEYAQSLEAEMQRSTLAVASSGASSAQDLASSTAAQSSERELISKLRQVRASGRIVLEFDPNSSGTSNVPNIALEDGDTFVVPHVPANVNVIGAVYDQNSFLYNKSRKVGSYLQLAGGPNRSADRKHTFVIRANGEVVSRDATNGLWNASFDKLKLNPGDTIVVPEKTFRTSALRGFLDWSQVFSQLSLGAAAINVIR